MNVLQRMTVVLLWMAFCLFIGNAVATAQETVSSVTDVLEPIQGPAVAPPGPFFVDRVSFEVDGASRPGPLLLVSGLEAGATADTIEELEALLRRARQDLMNRRVFDEITVVWSVAEADATAGEQENAERSEDSAGIESVTPIRAVFHIDDGWTLLPIAFYRYNSNSGHNPFVVLYWDNILGTLTDFGVSAGYYSRNWITSFGWDVRLDWRRVRMLGRQWNFSFDQEFETFEQASPEGEVELAYTGYFTSLGVSTSFRISDRLRYSISPNIGLDYGYDTITNETSQTLPADRAAAGFSHGLTTGGIDWVNNLRRGWSASLSNGISYDPEQRDWQADVGLSYSHHWLPQPRISPAIRARVSHNFDGDKLSRGGIVRGVADNRVFGATVVAVNTQVAILAVDWVRVADIQIIPFVDIAVARKEGTAINSDDVAVGFGADLVVFPVFMRGFQGRLSFGLDAREFVVGRPSRFLLEFSVTETLQI
ncbi:MAG: hypothetical protein WD492_06825 [Alkalispirochaeta sp.]